MRKRSCIVYAFLIVASLCVWSWLAEVPGEVEPKFRDKPASYWITKLNQPGFNFSDLNEPAADPVLFRALGSGTGLPYRTYTNLWSLLPARLQRRLPQPVNYRFCHAMALFALRGHQATRLAIPALRYLVNDDDPFVGGEAMGLLVWIAPGDSGLLPIFIRATREPKSRQVAVYALGYYTNQSSVVIPYLEEAVGDPSLRVRIRAAEALSRIDPKAVEKLDLIPMLCAALTDTDDFNRSLAALALGEIGQKPEMVVPDISQLLSDPNPLVHNAAAASLAKFQTEAKSAVPALLSSLKYEDSTSQIAISKALKEIDPQAAAMAGVK